MSVQKKQMSALSNALMMSVMILTFWQTALVTMVAAEVPPIPFDASGELSLSNDLWTGAVVMVGTPDTVLFKQSWGWIDKKKTARMPADAMFDLASLTKVIGATSALALCVDRGWIEPDVAFTNYLPGYSGTLQGTVSVRDLARHLSGFDNRKPYDVEGQVTEKILAFSPIRAAGLLYEYSCGNFILLGLIAEQVSGENLDEFCREQVFEPLGMNDTCWAPLSNPDPLRVARQAVVSVPLGAASDPPAHHAGQPIGNAGLFSTAADLTRFCRMMLANGVFDDKRVFSENATRLLGTRPDTRSPVAFGWRVNPIHNPPSLSSATMSHTGWTGTSIWIDPVQQCYVLVLTNRSGDHGKATRARLELADQVLTRSGITMPSDSGSNPTAVAQSLNP